ncbi:MAG: hypothetical protein ACLR7G_12945 [[Clostridium] symbiosum]
METEHGSIMIRLERYGRDGSRQQEAGTIWIPATVHCGLGGRTSADIYFI